MSASARSRPAADPDEAAELDAVVIGGGAAGRIRGARTSPEVEDESGSAAPQPSLSNGAESRLVEALRAGDEEAFVQLVRLHGPSLLRIARLYTSSRAVAEEVLQETWLGVLTGVRRFEGRSSLRTWLFRILVNKAKTRAALERRSVSFAELSDEEVAAPELSVEADRFRGAGERWAHHWTLSPQRWAEHPEASLLSQETIATVEPAAASLPPNEQLSSSATWWAATPTRCATRSGSPRQTSAYSSTAHAQRSAGHSSNTSHRPNHEAARGGQALAVLTGRQRP
jgi:RNA polymerase sigma-70 factor, ECF subfamily